MSHATALRRPADAAGSVPAGAAAPDRAGRLAARPAPGLVRLRALAAGAVLAAAAWFPPDAAAGQAGTAAGPPAASAAVQSGNEIDAFMERVLENRDASWRRIGDFVLREVLTLDVDGPAGLPISGFRHEYEWYVREDAVVRSPRRFDGVDIGEAERREYEADWVRRRERRAAERREERRRAAEEAAAAAERDAPAAESAARAAD